MNNAGGQKDAAWYFMQWASSVEHDLFGARKMDFVNPVRASVWKDDEFRARIDKSYPGYLNQYEVSAPGAKIYFTAQPLFFDLTTAGAEDAIDGIKVDRAGNVFVSGPGGLWIFSAAGVHLGTLRGPEHPHNMAWGDSDGQTLYLAAQTGIYRIRLNVPGASTLAKGL